MWIWSLKRSSSLRKSITTQAITTVLPVWFELSKARVRGATQFSENLSVRKSEGPLLNGPSDFLNDGSSSSCLFIYLCSWQIKVSPQSNFSRIWSKTQRQSLLSSLVLHQSVLPNFSPNSTYFQNKPPRIPWLERQDMFGAYARRFKFQISLKSASRARTSQFFVPLLQYTHFLPFWNIM